MVKRTLEYNRKLNARLIHIKQMSKTKIVIGLVAIAALTLVIVGLASAQITANQTPVGATPNTAAPNNGGFFWLDWQLFGYGANQGYGNQNVVPQAPSDGSTPVPAPYQGGFGYGYVPCMGIR
jgi:hypothetical protein